MCATAVTAGCSAPSGDEAAPSSAATPPAETPSATPTPTPTEAPWATFTTDDGLASWQLPGDWQGLPPDVDPFFGSVAYEVLDANGDSRLSYQHKIQGVGGPGCDAGSMPVYPYARLDETPMSIPVDPATGAAPTVAFDTLDEGDRVVAVLGSTSDTIAGSETCENAFWELVSGPGDVGLASFTAHGGSGFDATRLEFASLDEATAYLDSDEYRTIVRVISSLSFPPATPTGPVATAAPVTPTAANSPLSGAYLIDTDSDCGNFPLAGQTLTVDGAEASVTTPGQVLHGTLTRISRQWEVRVEADDRKTTVVLDGIVADGAFVGHGSTGGINPSGETGWACDIETFRAAP